MKEKLKKVFQLFITFIKIGAFTFGGGYAMVPLIQRETVEKKKWINDDDILEIVAIAESTPGPIAVNSATFVGYKTAGVLGAAAATIGVVLPSFTIIYFISFVIDKFENNTAVKYAFSGIRAYNQSSLDNEQKERQKYNLIYYNCICFYLCGFYKYKRDLYNTCLRCDRHSKLAYNVRKGEKEK